MVVTSLPEFYIWPTWPNLVNDINPTTALCTSTTSHYEQGAFSQKAVLFRFRKDIQSLRKAGF